MGDLFDRWLEHHDQRPESRPGEQGAEPALGVPAPRTADQALHTIFFRPRKHARRLYTVLFLLALAATVVLGATAWRLRTTTGYELTAVAAGLTAILYAVRAGSATATMTVTGGSLEIRRGGSRTTLDLASPHLRLEVVGRPGGRHWKVLFLRPSLPAYVVDASMVDPGEFMRVLRYYRQDLRPESRANGGGRSEIQ